MLQKIKIWQPKFVQGAKERKEFHAAIAAATAFRNFHAHIVGGLA
jgi:hypothetical protein